MTAGRVEALINVPDSVSVSVANSGGGATSVGLTAGSYFWSDARTVTSLADHIATQLNTDQAPSSGSWTISVSASTGLCSIGCTGTTAIPSFSLAWTSAALRDILGFERDIDYAQTAAHIAADLGYGDFSSGAGYLCNEASGNLSPVFGSGALVATNTPTYGSTGPRGGTDKAVGCGASGSSLGSFVASSSSLGDVGATDDILVVVVVEDFGSGGSFSYLPIKGPVAATAPYWRIVLSTDLRLSTNDGTNAPAASIATPTAPCVLVGALSRSTNKMAFGAQVLATGVRTVSALVDATGLGTLSNTDFLRLGPGNNTSALKIAAFYLATGSGVATSVPENISTAVANYAATFGTRTGTKQCRGLWLPDCVLNFSESYAKAAPTKSDMRSSQSPDGTLLSLVGNTWLEHASAMWKFVPKARVWEAETEVDNASWEFWFRGTQLGLDSTGWFTPSSPVLLVDHSGSVVGINANSGAGTDGWQIRGLSDIAPKVSPEFQDTDLMWVIELPALVSAG